MSEIVTYLFVVPPVITSPPISQTTIEPGTTVFSCIAFGQPPPKISWKRTIAESSVENTLAVGGRFSIDSNSSLIITSTRYEDRGTYTCIAMNNLAEMKTDKSSTQLVVNGLFLFRFQFLVLY